MAIKFNNPGNIRLSGDVWQGQIIPGDSSSFVTFQDLKFGFRALFVLLKNYIASGKDSIELILYKYAPPSENNTENYISYVSNRTGIDRHKVIDPGNYGDIYKIGYAMSIFETGVIPDSSKAQEGFTLAYRNGSGDVKPETDTMAAYLIGFSFLALIYMSQVRFKSI